VQSLLVSEFFVVFLALAGGAQPLDLPGALSMMRLFLMLWRFFLPL
jgi:hypothetical protein